MKLLIGIIITLFVSVWMALSLRHDPGYAMFSMGQWTVETSFAFLILVLIALFVAFYALVRLAMRLWHTPGQTLAAHQRRLQRKARRLFNLGSRQLAAGQWAAAEKTLLKSATHSETPALDYLSAARATHHLNDVKWRRDLHLRKAEESPDADKLTVQLTRAEFLLDDRQAEQARPSWNPSTPSTRVIRACCCGWPAATGKWAPGSRCDNCCPNCRNRRCSARNYSPKFRTRSTTPCCKAPPLAVRWKNCGRCGSRYASDAARGERGAVGGLRHRPVRA